MHKVYMSSRCLLMEDITQTVAEEPKTTQLRSTILLGLHIDFQVHFCYKACSITNGEYYDDCNAAAKRTAAYGHVIWILYLDHVDCNVVSSNMRVLSLF